MCGASARDGTANFHAATPTTSRPIVRIINNDLNFLEIMNSPLYELRTATSFLYERTYTAPKNRMPWLPATSSELESGRSARTSSDQIRCRSRRLWSRLSKPIQRFGGQGNKTCLLTRLHQR